ncbi:MAG TPA: phenylalanine--tRNA ligase subunit alpha [Chloroflexota bacterium]|nr:phenylalanine--tRNA ligase subunit alpha [Chloroflexota bacterium]
MADYDPQPALGELNAATTLDALEQWRVKHLGDKSALRVALGGLGRLPADQRREAGQRLNTARRELTEAYEARQAEMAEKGLTEQLERERIDVTLPGRPLPRGHSHPTITVIQEICDLFRRIGFQIIEGPEVEWEHYNFTKLNIPPDHPARDLTDTFWITDKMLLRTHTSPNQIRAMERVGQPPIRVLVPGRCYRNEATDASHESTFFQIEGLMVDDRTTMADMKGVLTYMARGLFGQDKRTRFRCDYFPFVEPGAEMSVSCGQCDGAGCRMCKYTGWLEILGCGMVHPDVLRGVNIDPAKYSGWAFGLGVERIAILKYGIDDIRLFQQDDIRFLRQVG